MLGNWSPAQSLALRWCVTPHCMVYARFSWFMLASTLWQDAWGYLGQR